MDSAPNIQLVRDSESPLIRFGAELRRYRMQVGLSQVRVGERIGCSQDLISQIELGKRRPSKVCAQKLDQIFGLSDRKYFVGLYDRIIVSVGRRWSLRWVKDVEQRAGVLRSWDPLLIPGLLQVESYARYLFRRSPTVASDEVEQCVTGRMRRKVILDQDDPPVVWALIDEWVLRRPIGGSDVMREQLAYLLEAVEHPSVTIQIVPASAACAPGLQSAFALAELLPGVEPDTVFVESATGGVVTDDQDIVARIRAKYDTIRADAYSQGDSLTIIKDALEQWIKQI